MCSSLSFGSPMMEHIITQIPFRYIHIFRIVPVERFGITFEIGIISQFRPGKAKQITRYATVDFLCHYPAECQALHFLQFRLDTIHILLEFLPVFGKRQGVYPRKRPWIFKERPILISLHEFRAIPVVAFINKLELIAILIPLRFLRKRNYQPGVHSVLDKKVYTAFILFENQTDCFRIFYGNRIIEYAVLIHLKRIHFFAVIHQYIPACKILDLSVDTGGFYLFGLCRLHGEQAP